MAKADTMRAIVQTRTGGPEILQLEMRPRPAQPRADQAPTVAQGGSSAPNPRKNAATLPGASWQRCRTHYADLRVMPTWSREPLSGAGLALGWSA